MRYQDADNKPLTTCFRKTFTVDDPTHIENLFLRLNVDDGAAVYLNGQEVARLRLPAEASAETPAFDQAVGHGIIRFYFRLPAENLRKGNNSLAVEVHQASAYSADLHFELTLSSQLPDLRPLRQSNAPAMRRELCRMLGELALTDQPDADQLLSTSRVTGSIISLPRRKHPVVMTCSAKGNSCAKSLVGCSDILP